MSRRPNAWPIEHRRRHAEAEHEGHQQEHDDIGVGGRRQRLLAEEAADPDRVDRAVQRLEDRRSRASAGRRRAGSRRSARSGRAGRAVVVACPRRRASAGHQPGALGSTQPRQRRRYFSASDAFSAWSARAFSTASGLARSTKLGLARRRGEGVALLLRGLGGLGEAGALGGDVDHAFERQDEGRLVDDDLRGAARPAPRRSIVSIRARRCERGVVALEPLARRPPASRTWSAQLGARRHVELGARGADAADQADQPVDLRARPPDRARARPASAIWRGSADRAARPSRSTIPR